MESKNEERIKELLEIKKKAIKSKETLILIQEQINILINEIDDTIYILKIKNIS